MHKSQISGQSYAFASFAMNSMIYIFAYRSLRRSIFHSGHLGQNKPLIAALLSGLLLAIGAFLVPSIRDVLGIIPLNLEQWIGVFGVAFSLLVIVEIGKKINNCWHRELVARPSHH
jgi:Ca2+-transporting ATPase